MLSASLRASPLRLAARTARPLPSSPPLRALHRMAGPLPGTAPGGSAAAPPPFLAALSPAQLAAATAPPSSPLQILAGPGSGKTRVLTSRAAWLVLERKLLPEDIVVITFTNKAAGEMRERLHKLIGPDRTSRLVLGTFHATMVRYLRRYGRLIDLPNNFSVLDADDSKKAIKEALKTFDNAPMGITLKPEQCLNEISRAKSREEDAQAFAARLRREQRTEGSSVEVKLAIAEVYFEYEGALQRMNGLDFDDLLLKGCQLLRQPGVVSNVLHVLVDEFQDTNTTQYTLMSLFAAATTPNLLAAPGLLPPGGWTADEAQPVGLSIVGDPDQSIYAWRNAEVTNLEKMFGTFAGTRRVKLEENFRSTGAILEASLRVVEQDTERVAKGLYTSHPAGVPVVLKDNASASVEAAFIATEIKRLVAYTGGLLNYNDFAVLLRYNALSREVERSLQQEQIPSRMLGGSKFFDRVEIKDLLAYLTLAENLNYTPAFVRVVNVPKRAIGEKTVQDLLAKAEELGVAPMTLAESIVSGNKSIKGIKPGLSKSLKGFVEAVVRVRSKAAKGAPVSALIHSVIKSVGYEGHLQKIGEYESRWENVKELVNFADLVAQSVASGADEDGIAQRIRLARDALELDRLDEDEVEAAEEDEDDGMGLSDDEGPAAATVKPEGGRAGFTSGAALKRIADEADADDVEHVSTREKRARRQDPALKPEPVDVKPHVTPPVPQQPGASRESAIELDLSDDDDARPSRGTPSEELAKAPAAPSDGAPSALRTFLQACTLSTDMQNEGQDEGPKVTIATCHAAKGLEFGVVFVVGVEEGNMPFYRSTEPAEIAEERRLLYVACTRAQCMLYLTHAAERFLGGGGRDAAERSLSRFVAPLAERGKYRGGTGPPAHTAPSGAGGSKSKSKAASIPWNSATRPAIDSSICRDLATVLERPLPDGHAEAMVQMKKDFETTSTAAAIRRPEPLSHAAMMQRYASYGGGYGSEEYGGDRGFDDYTQSSSSSRPAGGYQKYRGYQSYSTYTAPGRSAGASTGGQVYDVKRSKPSFNPPGFSSAARLRAAPGSTGRELLEEAGFGSNGGIVVESDAPIKPRPKADLASFESANSASLSSFMDLLPPAAGPAAGSSAASHTPQIRNPASSGGRRLGTGRPRPAGVPGAKRAGP